MLFSFAHLARPRVVGVNRALMRIFAFRCAFSSLLILVSLAKPAVLPCFPLASFSHHGQYFMKMLSSPLADSISHVNADVLHSLSDPPRFKRCYPSPKCLRASSRHSRPVALARYSATVGNSRRLQSIPSTSHRVRKKSHRVRSEDSDDDEGTRFKLSCTHHPLRQRLSPGTRRQWLAPPPASRPSLFPSASSSHRVSVDLQLVDGAFCLNL
ncbi:hypothetical protein K438DRAFT_1986213 [Mycena galopus ATCC 62051]|nr:hypothetical protein K438DRAFT_1986213 [Mycena galopus ATCC 62051]